MNKVTVLVLSRSLKFTVLVLGPSVSVLVLPFVLVPSLICGPSVWNDRLAVLPSSRISVEFQNTTEDIFV